MRSVRPANSAVAATGQTPGACGSSRAVDVEGDQKGHEGQVHPELVVGLGRLLHRGEVL